MDIRRRKQVELPQSKAELESVIERAQATLKGLDSVETASPLTSSGTNEARSPSCIAFPPPLMTRKSPASATSYRTPSTLDPLLSPDFDQVSDSYPSFVGANLHGFGTLSGHSCPPELFPLLYDDGEGFLDRENEYADVLARSDDSRPAVDLSARACWRNQQSFVRNILSWYPIFEEKFCTYLVKEATDNDFNFYKSSSCLAYFIFALGALSRADDTLDLNSPAETPGLNYFQAGCKSLESISIGSSSLERAQCYMLKS